jgi:hypothetical protein
MAMKFQQGDYVVQSVSPRAGALGEGRTGLDVVMPPQLRALIGKTVTPQELEDLGAQMAGDDMVLNYGDREWVITLSS